MMLTKTLGFKKHGTPITDAMVEAIAEVAEAGYDVTELHQAKRTSRHGCRARRRRVGLPRS